MCNRAAPCSAAACRFRVYLIPKTRIVELKRRIQCNAIDTAALQTMFNEIRAAAETENTGKNAAKKARAYWPVTRCFFVVRDLCVHGVG